jgi:PAS domain S-box-containing protein
MMQDSDKQAESSAGSISGLRLNSEDVRLVLDHSGQAYLITDRDAIIRYVTPAVTRITGYTEGELLGRSTRIFKSDKTPPDIHRHLWNTILDRKQWKGILINTRKSGEQYVEHLTVTPITDDGDTIRNFLALKKPLDEFSEHGLRAPGTLAADAPAQSGDVLTFVSRLAGELKNSIYSANGFAQLLHEGLLPSMDDVQKEYFSIILQSNARLLHVLDDVATFVRLRAGDIAFRLSMVPLAKELRRTVDALLLFMRPQNVRVSTFIDDKGALVSLDRNCFEQILSNLLSNALKFTRSGVVAVTMETRDTLVEVAVTDTGVGISEAFKPFLFTPFCQEELGFSAEQEGAGLGLAITRRLVEMMGATMSFESIKNEGSTFTVTFPIAGWEQARVAIRRTE